MGETSIQWTDRTWNPVRGCSRVSEGCRNCYAERIAARFSGPGQPFHDFAKQTETGGPTAGAAWTGKVELIPEKLDEPLRWRKPCRVFVNSMSDLFHEKLSDDAIADVFTTMASVRRHTFQVLTKRSARMLSWCSNADTHMRQAGILPAPNVWLGVSVEDQATLWRIDELKKTPAAKRFISYEPALEDLGKIDLTGIDWVIYGGESGPGARPNEAAWARATVKACKAAGVACFVKQMGRWILGDDAGFETNHWLFDDGHGFVPPIIGPHAGQHPVNAVGFSLWDAKGGDPAEWPEDLRIREFPGQRRLDEDGSA